MISEKSFTFHNVSINSHDSIRKGDYTYDLHSIMYLLIRGDSRLLRIVVDDLHSIMYLLILLAERCRKLISFIYIP